MSERIWKALDIAGLLLLAGVLGFFTYLMGRSLWDSGTSLLSGGSFATLVMASVLFHVLAALALSAFGALLMIGYRATH